MKEKIQEFLIGLVIIWTVYLLLFARGQVIFQAGYLIIGICIALIVLIQLASYLSSRPGKLRHVQSSPSSSRPTSTRDVILGKIQEASQDIEAEESRERQRIEQQVKQNPEDQTLRLSLARSNRPKGVRYQWNAAQRNRVAKAEVEYKRAIQIQPDLIEAHLELGLLYSAMTWQMKERKDAFARAETELSEAIRLNPHSIEALRAIANLNRRSKNYERAAKQIKLAVQVDPNDKLTLFAYGRIMSELGNSTDAGESFRKLFPEYNQELHKVEVEALITDFHTGKIKKLGLRLKDKNKNQILRTEEVQNFGWLD